MRSIILESILLTLLSINPISALTFDCANIIVSDKKFDLSPLAPASHERIAVDWIRDQPPSVVNTSFVLGLCKNLDTKAVAAEYGLLDGETCAAGSRGEILFVLSYLFLLCCFSCAFQYLLNRVGDKEKAQGRDDRRIVTCMDSTTRF